MSTDTQALFEVADASRALEAIRQCATTTTADPLRRVSERFYDRWNPKQWEYDVPDNLLGPGGFSIRAKGRIVEVYHLLTYSTFTEQGEDGRLVLSAFCFMCRLVGANEMLLTHELLPCEGASLDAICEGLIDQIGPPAKDWAELHNSSLFEPRCWLRLTVNQEAGSGLLSHLAAGEQPCLHDPWAVWRGKTESYGPKRIEDRPWPRGGKIYMANALFARPPEAGSSVYQQETCYVGFKTMSVAEAYRRAYDWGQAHATEAPGEVWFLAVSHLATLGNLETDLLTPEQSAELKRVREEMWPNGVGHRDERLGR